MEALQGQVKETWRKLADNDPTAIAHNPMRRFKPSKTTSE
jgi:hypothetical protein